LKNYRPAVFIRDERISEAGHIDADQLEFGAHVKTGEYFRSSGNVIYDYVGHFVTGRHQPVNSTVVQCAFTDGKH
jgi:hypothetical protein